MKAIRFLVFVFIASAGLRPAASAELVMVEQAGCAWCEAWDQAIAPAYPNTAEGRLAPLRRVNIHDALPEDLAFIRRLVYTPTFVLVHDGREVGRITGYPGEDFFWGLLGQLVEKLPASARTDTRAGLLPVPESGNTNPQAPRG